MYDSGASLEDKMGRDWQSSSDSEPSEEEERMEILLDEPVKRQEGTEVVVSEDKNGKSERKFPEEEDEEILKESNSRFVLFPIKYREVGHAAEVLDMG
jgi:hypothetical protein